MILITVGTEKFPFNRLMQWIDNLIKQNDLNPEQEKIVVQYGSCTIVPERVKGYAVLKETAWLTLVEQARLIVAHCGEGSMDLLASIDKPFILVPRVYKLKEHVDDHQVELAQELAKLGIPIANTQADLADFLANPYVAKFPVTPAKYYAQASVLLEEEFETDFVREQLTRELVDFWELISASS